MTTPDSRDATLAIPEGWVIDRSSRERLVRQLGSAGPNISGIVAAPAALSAGSSYRVCSERASLRSRQDLSAVTDLTVRGAVLVRPDVGFDVGDGVITVEHGDLVVDPGATVHDPWTPLAGLDAASSDGRPPFPWRPVVLFLGTERDPDLADWVRSLVNNMVRRSTEGRIAVPEPTGGLHLTRPCAPSQQSVAALAPDVVVALDDAALELAEQWLGDDRSAVIVQLTAGTTDAIDLVSWRIGQASGRLRARFGRGVGADAMVDLVRRLCAGPQPLPPRDDAQVETRVPLLAPRQAREQRPVARPVSILALVASGSVVDRARYDAFADHADAVGDLTVTEVTQHAPHGAEKADLVMVRGLSRSEPVLDLVRRRRSAGRPTVVDVGPSDLQLNGPGSATLYDLTPNALQLVTGSGLVVTPSPTVAAWLRCRGVRAHLLPTLLSRARVEALHAQRSGYERRGPPILGWNAGPGGAGAAPGRRAVLALIPQLLQDRPLLRVEVVGDATDVAAQLGRDPRLTVAPGDPHTRTVLRWTAQLWTPPELETEVSGDRRTVIEAHCLGVPTVVTATNPAVRDGLVGSALTVEADARAEAWLEAIVPLLDDGEEWSRRSAEVVALAEGLYGPATAAAAMNRFVGWSRFEGES